MATVTGYTAAKMQEIIDETVSGAHITGDNLILELTGGDTVDAGNVRGPIGGSPSIVADEAARIALSGGDLFEGLLVFESDSKRIYIYTGTVWYYLYGGTNPTAARAYASGATTPGVNIWTKILLATESYDYGNNFGSSKYIVPEDGLYDIKGHLVVPAASVIADDFLSVSIMHSGGLVMVAQGTEYSVSITMPMSAAVADTAFLEAGDEIELWGLCSRALATKTGSEFTYLSIKRA